MVEVFCCNFRDALAFKKSPKRCNLKRYISFTKKHVFFSKGDFFVLSGPQLQGVIRFQNLTSWEAPKHNSHDVFDGKLSETPQGSHPQKPRRPGSPLPWLGHHQQKGHEFGELLELHLGIGQFHPRWRWNWKFWLVFLFFLKVILNYMVYHHHEKETLPIFCGWFFFVYIVHPHLNHQKTQHFWGMTCFFWYVCFFHSSLRMGWGFNRRKIRNSAKVKVWIRSFIDV